MIWMAAEPLIIRDPEPALNWFLENSQTATPLSGQLVRKTMRRICDSQEAEKLNVALDFIAAIPSAAATLAVAALDGLLEGQRGKALVPSRPPADFLAKLAKSPNTEVVARGRRLGTLWGDAAALQSTLKLIADGKANVDQRLQAIQSVRQQKIDAVRETLVKVLAQNDSEKLAQEILRALSEIGGDALAEEILSHWKNYGAATKRLAAEVLTSRGNWTRAFLTAVETKTVEPSEIPVPVLRSLTQSKDD
jgi:hypothetical protein